MGKVCKAAEYMGNTIKLFNNLAEDEQSVFYDEQDEIWIVSFGKESNEIILGGDCSIAIQKADGKVLRIWFGE